MSSALVTGASRGIGRGIALRLARRGYQLTITSRTESDLRALAPELLAAGATEVAYEACDMGDREALPELVALHAARFKAGMDALIVNAGVGTAGPIGTLSMNRLDKTLEVNFISALVLIQSALPLLRGAADATPKQGAKIVALSSITGAYAEPGLAVYGASKAALLSLIETVNLEESGNGVTATAIAPAYVDTDMAAWTTDTIPAETMIPVADVVSVVEMLIGLSRNTAISRIVMGRSGTTGRNA